MQQKSFTISSTKCTTTDTLIARIPEMRYGLAKIGETDIPVCNVTQYHNLSDDIKGEFTPSVFVNDFLDKMGHVVNSIVDMYDIPYNAVILTNQDGELLVNSQLDMAVVCYYFPEVMTEAIDYTRDIYVHLFAIDEKLLSQMCARNVPNEIIHQIAKSRGMEV